MTSFRKLIAIISIVVSVTFVVNGCTSGSKNANSTESTKPAATNGQTTSTASEKPKEKVKLVYAGYNGAWIEHNKKIIARFHERYPDSNIEIEVKDFPQGEDYNKAMDIAIASNEVYDIMLFHGRDIAARAEKGVLLDLTPLAEKDNFDFVENFGKIIEPLAVNGKHYLVPYTINQEMIWYNKDMLDAAGLKYPDENTTWAELGQMAEKLTKGEGNDKVYGYSQNGPAPNITLNPIVSDGWYMLKDATTPNFDDQRVKFIMEWFKDLFDKGVAPSPAQFKLEKLDNRILFAQERLAMMISNWWAPVFMNRLKYDNATISEDALKFNFDVTFLPKVTDSSVSKISNIDSSFGFASNSKTKHPEEVFQFIKFLTTECFDIIGVIPSYRKADSELFNNIYHKFTDSKGVSHDNEYSQALVDKIALILNQSVPAMSVSPRPAMNASALAAMVDLYNREAEQYYLGSIGIDDFIKKMQTEGTALGNQFK